MSSSCVAQHQQQQEVQNDETSTKLCEVCKTNSYKYKCPRCSRRTCSLTCVNSHKKSSGCTGKRDLTKFVPLSQFDDSTLLSDYNLLEDVKRVAESAQRIRTELCPDTRFKLPVRLVALREAAVKRRTSLVFFPPGMSKREKNQTSYNTKFKCIYWTIELRFQTADVTLLEHKVRENVTLRSLIQKHLQPSPWRNKLRRFSEVPVDDLKFFIRKNQKDSDSPYRELDLDTPLRQLFSCLIILEYPTIHVLLSTDHYDFKVVRDLKLRPAQPKADPVRDNTPPPAAICSKVEEIAEDENAPEPQSIDLLNFPEVNGCKPTSHGSQTDNKHCTESTTTEQPTSPPRKRPATESYNVLSSTYSQEVELLDTNLENIQFDQDLSDAYSFLMDQSTCDDFLAYKPEGEGEDHENTDIYFADLDELEEGEIPDL